MGKAARHRRKREEAEEAERKAAEARERKHADDPALSGGAQVSAGGPHDRNAVLYDTRNMVNVEEIEVSVAHPTSGGEPQPDAVALVIRGRRNRPPNDDSSAHAPRESVEHLNMMSWDGAADLVVELHALASRDGTKESFHKLLDEKWKDRVERGVV